MQLVEALREVGPVVDLQNEEDGKDQHGKDQLYVLQVLIELARQQQQDHFLEEDYDFPIEERTGHD